MKIPHASDAINGVSTGVAFFPIPYLLAPLAPPHPTALFNIYAPRVLKAAMEAITIHNI